MAKIFVPPSFFASEVSPKLVDALYALPDQAVVLMEFVSPGRHGRQVDLAVLGPSGMDVIEVKDIRYGTVVARDHGPWLIEEDSGSTTELKQNIARGQPENPWDQVVNTARDLEQGLSEHHGIPTRGGRGAVRLFTAVLIPERRPNARLRRSQASAQGRQFTSGLNGVEELSELRSMRRPASQREVWPHRHRLELAASLGLVELGVAIVEGTVTDVAGMAVVGATVRVGASAVATDDDGRFSFAVQAGTHEVVIEGAGITEPVRFSRAFVQGRTSGFDVTVSREAPSPPPAEQAATSEVQAMVEQFMARLDVDRAERETLFELLTDAVSRPPAEDPRPAPTPDLSDTVLDELVAIRSLLERLQRESPADVGTKTIERGMELVLALEAARSAEIVHRREPMEGSAAAAAPVPIRPVAAISLKAAPRARTTAQLPRVAPRRRRGLWGVSGFAILAVVGGVWLWSGSPDLDIGALFARVGPIAPFKAIASEAGDHARDVDGDRLGVSTAAPTSGRIDAGGDAMPSAVLPGVPVGTASTVAPGVPPVSRAECPTSHPVKGNVNVAGDRIFHVPGQQYYVATHPELCFRNAADAQADGFRASLR